MRDITALSGIKKAVLISFLTQSKGAGGHRLLGRRLQQ